MCTRLSVAICLRFDLTARRSQHLETGYLRRSVVLIVMFDVKLRDSAHSDV